MKRMCLLAIVVMLTTVLKAQDLVGQWIGTMIIPGAELRIVFNVKRTGSGYTTWLDSPSRGVKGIPMFETLWERGNVTFQGQSGFRYVGKFAGKDAIKGVLEEAGQQFSIELSRIQERLGVCPLSGSGFAGTWMGVLKTPYGLSLKIIFHVSRYGDEYISAMDSPDQGSKGTPVRITRVTGQVIRLEIPSINLIYEGTLGEDGLIGGTLLQAGQAFPMELNRVTGNGAYDRPQEPKGAFPYAVEEVKFENRTDGVTLAGTLTLPEGEKDCPVVVLISGSGPQNRNSEMFGHKPFLVIADYLTRRGIGVLRFDDRGVGLSNGVFARASFWDHARDVAAAVEFLKKGKGVKQVGLIGHSEGGMIAPIVASGSKDVAFVVSLAGIGIPGCEVLLSQQEAIAREMGVTEVERQKTFRVFRGVYDIMLADTSLETTREALTQYLKAQLDKEQITDINKEDAVQRLLTSVLSPGLYSLIKYNPASVLSRVKCPVLVLNGSRDLQVLPGINLDGIRKGLAAAGNRKVMIKELPGLNHLFQECESGSLEKYGEITQTFSPVALQILGDWISEICKIKC